MPKLAKVYSSLIAVGILVGSLVGHAVPAQAHIVNREYNVTSEWNGNGSTRAWGDITWYSRGKVAISGRVNDRCPADRHGAYFWVDVWFMNGEWKGKLMAKDLGGCGDPNGVAFSKVFDTGRRIECARLIAYELNPVTGDYNDTRGINKDNPHTGRSDSDTPCDLYQ